MKIKLTICRFLIVFMALAFWGCTGGGDSNSQQDTRQLDRALVDGQTCTPSTGTPGTRITCPADMARADGCNIMFDTQLVPRATITYNANRTISFVTPPAAAGLYNISKICGAQQTVVAHQQVTGRLSPGGSGGAPGNSDFAECAAGGNQCQVGTVCRSNRCVAACNSTYDCPGGQICRDQQCVNNADPECDNPLHPERTCSGAKAGLVCVHGSCEPCRDNLACGNKGPDFTGFVCSASNVNSSLGLCQPCQTGSQCNAGQACVADGRGVGRCGSCTINSQCGEGNVCNIRTGQCVNNGISSNAGINTVVTEVPNVLGLLRIDWTIRGMQAASIREAYVYGPFGADNCNNILRTSENVIPVDPQPRHGTACRDQVSNGQHVCQPVDGEMLRSSSVDVPQTPIEAPRSPLPTPPPDVERPPVDPSAGTTRVVYMTCRVPINQALNGSVYTTMKVSPSVFRSVVVTTDNQVFTGEGRFMSGGTDLRIDRVDVSTTTPTFVIRGSYTRTESVPTFEGCDGGVSESNSGGADLTADRVSFSQRCNFPLNTAGALPTVTVNLESATPDQAVSKTISIDNCQLTGSLSYTGMYDTSGSLICDSTCLSQSMPGVGAPQLREGVIDLRAAVRNRCSLHIDEETQDINVPWGIQVGLGDMCPTLASTSVNRSNTEGVTIAADGVVTISKSSPRTPSCYTYYLRREGNDLTAPIRLPYNMDASLVVPSNAGSADDWRYDFKLVDTDSLADFNGYTISAPAYCHWTNYGGDDALLGFTRSNYDDDPNVCLNVPITERPITWAGFSSEAAAHDGEDGIDQCSNYRVAGTRTIQSLFVGDMDVKCCVYGELPRRRDNAAGLPNISTIDDPLCGGFNGRSFTTHLVNTRLASDIGGRVSTSFNFSFYGEYAKCRVRATSNRTIKADFDIFVRPAGYCDSPVHDRADADDTPRNGVRIPSTGFVLPDSF